jgi:hypothetical protein
MINELNLVKKINRLLNNKYPIKLEPLLHLNEINKLKISVLGLKKFTEHKYIPFQFDLNGNILSGKFKNYKIITVITNKSMTWDNFIKFYVSCFYDNFNPCINENYILDRLHKLNFIDEYYKIIVDSIEKGISPNNTNSLTKTLWQRLKIFKN